MPKLELSVKQVIELVKQLPAEEKSAVLQALNTDKETRSANKLSQKTQEMRSLSAERGLDWDKLSEDDKEVLATSLLKK